MRANTPILTLADGTNDAGDASARQDLEGCSILIAEDEALVAMALAELVEDMGGTVLGPFAHVSQCRSEIDAHRIDAAILDVRLCDGTTYELAQRLMREGVPVLFHSANETAREFEPCCEGTVINCEKPCEAEVITRSLLKVVE
ncbi:response regulator [Qipengyuania atrilutea]|uniref:Response regulator n=1 Tax=Qipengyuania atrilutea TaxID=2744473 RepID=A0A850H758_9SPHN|nr:response regulator [Actirhodobacter atriluteus]NVD45035.1 response regulator [Actirhodobacter atriluteus]